MNFDKFVRDESSRYELFAKTVTAILQAAIDAQPRDFRLQQIQWRAKDARSLKRKLTERGLLESNAIEDELKDLAGCRLIFYTNTDVDRFLSSRVIFENFVVDFDGSKIHHATGTERTAEQLYFGIHYLVSFKEDRLALPEYAQFRGMRCEVQLQTILNHAWAETSHDILYHPAAMPGFGTKQFDAIKERLTRIMNQYLLPAGYEFQKVQQDYERLLAGKELFDRGTLEALGQAKDNNERQEQLQRIRKALLPFYDDVPAIAPDVMRRVAKSIKDARDAPTILIETPFGDFDGRTAQNVADEGLQLIEDLRFVDVALTFKLLCDLYLGAQTEEERKRISQSFEALARNDLNVWKQVGFGVQKTLYEAILALPEGEKKALRPVIVSLCDEFLDTELQGTTWHFDSVSLQRGAVHASAGYSEFRGNVLAVLFGLYGDASSQVDKLVVTQALSTATRFPMDGGRADLVELVLDDTLKIIEFYRGRVDEEPFQLLQHLEHQFLFLYRRSKEMAVGNLGPTIGAKAAVVVSAIEAFRDRANGDDRYVKFKTLVGFESVFPAEWGGDAMDIEGPRLYRAAQITQFAASITSENAAEWYDIIKLCASVKSEDMATFPSFGEFLKQLAARSPDIVIGYLEKDDEVLNNFLPAILGGLAEGARPEEGLALVTEWIDSGKHLAAIAHYLRFADKTSPELVRKLGQQAIKLKDANAAIGTLTAIIARQLLPLVDDVFLPIMRMLTEMGDARWVHATWYLPTLRPFLDSLSEVQSRAILDNMVLRGRIEHHDEWILRELAKRHAEIVWHFFKKRIDRKGADESEDRYEPVPYQMTELAKPLARDAGLAVRIVRSWYAPDDYLFTFSGGRMLQNVFPAFTSDFEAELIALARTGNEDDVNFVLSILGSYRGGQFLHEVCKAIVEALPDGDKRLGKVEVILESTGVVFGRFGMVQAYQGRKEEVQSWLTDERQKVRAFAEKYQRLLDRSIASEQRRSETEYELSRRDWQEEE
jgi:ppGpp synthetase/RelA/SpoT-type nucleotidyltranferase